jgi:hypothetical protein
MQQRYRMCEEEASWAASYAARTPPRVKQYWRELRGRAASITVHLELSAWKYGVANLVAVRAGVRRRDCAPPKPFIEGSGLQLLARRSKNTG